MSHLLVCAVALLQNYWNRIVSESLFELRSTSQQMQSVCLLVEPLSVVQIQVFLLPPSTHMVCNFLLPLTTAFQASQ